MSEDNQENGTANGDVPEIELIIKDEIQSVDDSDTESNAAPPAVLIDDSVSTNDQYIIFELKTDAEPMFNYVITQVKKPPPDDGDPIQNASSGPVENQNNPGPQQNTTPYVITVQIPLEGDEEETKENSKKSMRALNRKRLLEAVDSVVNKQMTISKAATVFEVTKSTLWREVNKHTNHRRKKVDQELHRKIADRICAGETLSGISRSLKVAKSTLHQHKVRLAQSGQLPSNVKLRPPVDPSERYAMKERIIQAFRGCRVNGMSIRFAAKFFSIPPTTLWKYIRRFKASQQSVDADAAGPADENVKDIKEDVSEEQSNSNDETVDLSDFDVDAYCEQQEETASEDGDFLISFDFETFEEFVKRELD